MLRLASFTRSSRSPSVSIGEEENDSMAIRLGTSPATCPPMPSATAKALVPMRPRSWLLLRTWPVSLRRPPRNTAISAHLEHGATDGDLVAAAKWYLLGDGLTVHHGAVGRAEVLHVGMTVHQKD